MLPLRADESSRERDVVLIPLKWVEEWPKRQKMACGVAGG